MGEMYIRLGLMTISAVKIERIKEICYYPNNRVLNIEIEDNVLIVHTEKPIMDEVATKREIIKILGGN